MKELKGSVRLTHLIEAAKEALDTYGDLEVVMFGFAGGLPGPRGFVKHAVFLPHSVIIWPQQSDEDQFIIENTGDCRGIESEDIIKQQIRILQERLSAQLSNLEASRKYYNKR